LWQSPQPLQPLLPALYNARGGAGAGAGEGWGRGWCGPLATDLVGGGGAQRPAAVDLVGGGARAAAGWARVCGQRVGRVC